MEQRGALVGCAVLRVETLGPERLGYLVECFGEPAALVGVTSAAVARLQQLGVDRITCDVLDPPTRRRFAGSASCDAAPG